MLSGVRFRPFPLLTRQTITEGSDVGLPVIRFTFALHDKEATLGFGQPNTAVKICGPGPAPPPVASEP